MVGTLYKLSDLRETMFGRPPPRHGLNLLWWFANDCVQIDSNRRLTAQCNPASGAFGFHRFYNSGRFLPYSKQYYEVGNLNTPGSLPFRLPDYVTKNYTGYSDSSNTDRIVVSFDSSWNRFDSIYVTQHSDQTNFDQNHTYCISLDLLKRIKVLNRGHLHREMMKNLIIPQAHIRPHSTSLHQSLQGQRSHQSAWDFWDCSAERICALICALLLLFVFLFFLLKMSYKFN